MRTQYIGCTIYFHSSKLYNTVHFAPTSSWNLSSFCSLRQPWLVLAVVTGAAVVCATGAAVVCATGAAVVCATGAAVVCATGAAVVCATGAAVGVDPVIGLAATGPGVVFLATPAAATGPVVLFLATPLAVPLTLLPNLIPGLAGKKIGIPGNRKGGTRSDGNRKGRRFID